MNFRQLIIYKLPCILFSLITMYTAAQTNAINPSIKIESWMLIPENSNPSKNEKSPRTDLFFRRVRFDANGNITERISYNFLLAGDHWGIDAQSPEGGKYKGLLNGYRLQPLFFQNKVRNRDALQYAGK